MHPLGNPSSLKLSPRPSSIAGAVALSLNEIGLVLVLVSRPRPTQRVMLHTIFCLTAEIVGREEALVYSAISADLRPAGPSIIVRALGLIAFLVRRR